LRKNGNTTKLFIDFKKAYVSVRGEVLWSIHIESVKVFSLSLVSTWNPHLIKMCQTETCTSLDRQEFVWHASY
jgi:hypothetical protein